MLIFLNFKSNLLKLKRDLFFKVNTQRKKHIGGREGARHPRERQRAERAASTKGRPVSPITLPSLVMTFDTGVATHAWHGQEKTECANGVEGGFVT